MKVIFVYPRYPDMSPSTIEWETQIVPRIGEHVRLWSGQVPRFEVEFVEWYPYLDEVHVICK